MQRNKEKPIYLGGGGGDLQEIISYSSVFDINEVVFMFLFYSVILSALKCNMLDHCMYIFTAAEMGERPLSHVVQRVCVYVCVYVCVCACVCACGLT